MRKLFLTAIISAVCFARAIAGDIYVSAENGCDSNDGSKDKPLQTVAQAMRQAREWRRLKRTDVAGGINIILDNGVYRQYEPLFVRPEDSGTPESPTVVRSSVGCRAVISGGVSVSGWKRGCDDSRISPRLRNKIWVAEVPRAGNKILYTRQMWVAGVKALRATQFGDGVMERMKGFDTKERTITIPAPGFDLSNADQLEMTVHQRWAIAILRVKEMRDAGNGMTAVTFHEPESRLEFEHPWPQPVIDGERGSSSFCLGNALQLLDEPGEWYQDYPSGRIYYYPREGEDMTNTNVIIPALETIMDVSGTRERQVNNIKFENIAFEHAAWIRPSYEGHVTLQGGFRMLDAYKLHEPGLPEKAELENQAWIGRPESAITVRFASGIDFVGCTFSHVGATGLDYIKAVRSSRVEGCTFCDIGGTAIQVGTFPDGGFETHVPYIPAVPEDICSGIVISNNQITDATNEDWGCVGIGAGYVRDIDIVQNEVSHVNYSGICVGWGWTALESGMCRNKIRDNYVHDYARQLYDAGGVYTLSNQPGSVISGNRITAPYPAPYATNNRGFCIYFDEATDGFTVEGNKCDNEEFGYNRPGPKLKVGHNSLTPAPSPKERRK